MTAIVQTSPTDIGTTQFSLVNTNTEMSKDIGNIALALSQAQSELEAVGKGEKGYGYNYASLPSTIEVAKPILANHDLAVTQLVGAISGEGENRTVSLTTILIHKSGEYFKSFATMPLVEMKGCNVAQEMGATVSYLRRYALQAILNMSSEDNDASSNGFSKPSNKSSFKKETKSVAKKEEAPQKFRRKKKVAETDNDDI